MKLILISHGLKTDAQIDRTVGTTPRKIYAIPRADLYIDARCLYEPQIMGVGDTEADSMRRCQPSTLDRIMELIREGLRLIPIRRRNGEPKSFNDPVIICFLCAWGKNRSVTLKHIMWDKLQHNYDVEER